MKKLITFILLISLMGCNRGNIHRREIYYRDTPSTRVYTIGLSGTSTLDTLENLIETIHEDFPVDTYTAISYRQDTYYERLEFTVTKKVEVE